MWCHKYCQYSDSYETVQAHCQTYTYSTLYRNSFSEMDSANAIYLRTAVLYNKWLKYYKLTNNVFWPFLLQSERKYSTIHSVDVNSFSYHS